MSRQRQVFPHSAVELEIIAKQLKFLLTKLLRLIIIQPASGRLAQLVEHPLDVRKVAGSSPTSSTIAKQVLRSLLFLLFRKGTGAQTLPAMIRSLAGSISCHIKY